MLATLRPSEIGGAKTITFQTQFPCSLWSALRCHRILTCFSEKNDEYIESGELVCPLSTQARVRSQSETKFRL